MGFPLLDPDARQELTHPGFPGVTFRARAIARGRWLFLRNSMLLAMEKAERRAVADLKASGVDPDANLGTEAYAFTALQKRRNLDPEGEQEIFGLNLEIVRWGLVEVEGLELSGAPFHPGKEVVPHEGESVEILSRSGCRVLSAQPGLIVWLANKVWELNELGIPGKKS